MDDWFSAPAAFSPANLSRVNAEDIKLLAPITQDVQIFCQGLNYASHQQEGGIKAGKGQNLFFSKPPSAICGPRDDIIRPPGCELLDYEIELALILKRDVPAHTRVNADNLLDYVGGFLWQTMYPPGTSCLAPRCCNGLKARASAHLCVTGPILYLSLSLSQMLSNLRLTLSLNGDTRQDATTDQFIFKPDETLTELAAFTDVNKGDMLLTPGGVVLNANLKVGMAILTNFTNDEKRRKALIKSQRSVRYLQPGDRLTLSLQTADGLQDFGEQQCEVRDA